MCIRDSKWATSFLLVSVDLHIICSIGDEDLNGETVVKHHPKWETAKKTSITNGRLSIFMMTTVQVRRKIDSSSRAMAAVNE